MYELIKNHHNANIRRLLPFVFLSGNIQPHSNALFLGNANVATIEWPELDDLILQYMIMSEKSTKYRGWPEPPARGTFIKLPCLSSLRPGAMILGKPPLRLFWISTIRILFSCSRSCSLMCQATCSICSRASFKEFLSGCESGVFLITSSSSNLYLKGGSSMKKIIQNDAEIQFKECPECIQTTTTYLRKN